MRRAELEALKRRSQALKVRSFDVKEALRSIELDPLSLSWDARRGELCDRGGEEEEFDGAAAVHDEEGEKGLSASRRCRMKLAWLPFPEDELIQSKVSCVAATQLNDLSPSAGTFELPSVEEMLSPLRRKRKSRLLTFLPQQDGRSPRREYSPRRSKQAEHEHLSGDQVSPAGTPSGQLQPEPAQCSTPRLSWPSPLQAPPLKEGLLLSPKTQQARQRRRSPSECSKKVMRQYLKILLEPTADLQAATALVEELLFESLPAENVQGLRQHFLSDGPSKERFVDALQREGGDSGRVKLAWHLAGSATAAKAIETEGIRCDDGHCACGRYGRGGYLATSASKANAYADSACNGGERHVFFALVLPEEELLRGERGTRPVRTASDLPSHPTEYCFVDQARVHCVCRLDYSWVSTGRRSKKTTAGDHVRAWRSSSRKASPDQVSV